MTDNRHQALTYLENHHEEILGDLKQLVAIPSVSTSPEHKLDMDKAAEWIAAKLTGMGIENVQVMPTGGHPVVYGEWLKAGAKPTMLVYGHYDVQPTEPDELWLSGPFDAVIRGENLYGRGASDMKGQVIASLGAVESIMGTAGVLPVNVKFIIEGEEEIGSPNLGRFIEQHVDLLKSDFALNPDAGMIAPDVPTIVYGLRGLAYFELRVYGPAGDLHSGLFGGVVHNPAQALCELIAGMHDSQGRVTLPGYYDRVRPLSSQERDELARLPLDEAYYKQQTGVHQVWGEEGYTAAERVGARPTLEVNGLYSGFIGQGSKTVLPAYAMAKISMRLVPDQDPVEVHQQLLQYLEEHCPATVRWELTAMKGGRASMSDPHHPAAEALAKGLQSVWGVRPVYKREGGSVPVVGEMQSILGIESVLTGFGLPDDNLHAPNEKLHLPTWYKGIAALIHLFYNLETVNGFGEYRLEGEKTR